MHTLILACILFAEDNAQLTSRAMVHMGHWCTTSEVIWFANPTHLEWFQDEARRVGAIGPGSVLWPFLGDAPWFQDGTHMTDRIRGAVNAVRQEVFR